jgi:hypothetical protein
MTADRSPARYYVPDVAPRPAPPARRSPLAPWWYRPTDPPHIIALKAVAASVAAVDVALVIFIVLDYLGVGR